MLLYLWTSKLDLFQDLRLEVIEELLGVLVDELVDSVGKAGGLPVEQVVKCHHHVAQLQARERDTIKINSLHQAVAQQTGPVEIDRTICR